MCPSCLGRPYRFSRFTNSKSSTGILWYVTSDIPQCHKGFVRNCESHDVTSPLRHTFWRKCQSNNFTSIFYLEEWHAFCEVRVTWPNIAFTYSAPWSTYAFGPALKLPGHSCKARFPLETAASHVNSHWLVNPRRIVPETTQWKWTRGMWKDSCEARFLWKKPGMCGAVGRESYKFTRTLHARRVLLEKTHGIWQGFRDARFSCKKIRGSGWSRFIWIYSHKERDMHFTWENTRNLGGGVGAARIFHWKTQRFLRGGREWHINL